jgi:serine/threonine-protein kinase
MSAADADVSGSLTRLGASEDASALDHGRFAPGAVLAGRYRIVALLGRGGMGEVYRADDLTLGQAVALKFLPDRVDGSRATLDRLLSEVRTARQVSHPNVCRVHDVGDVDGRRFISMEYIDGEDLSVLLRRIGRLPADKGVEIARQLCAGLAASHERGVLHRDLKPANIMLDGRGRVRITDFGLAMALHGDGRGAGEVAGTPAYMAPEQLAGKPMSAQTDIYALGLVLYEVFTGRRFHNVSGLAELRDRHAESSVDLSSSEAMLEPAIARVIERCLDPDPRRRPASCALVAASLPGGDPLAAAIAAGETPSPQLVAAAAVEGALAPRWAAVLGAAFLASLAVVVTQGWNPAEQLGFTRSADVLAAQTRDLLASVGYPESPVDTAAGITYRYSEWRDPAILASSRPWSDLKARRPAAVFFWYREQPTVMAAHDMSRIGLEQLPMILRSVAGLRATEPPFEPGSIYVERGPDGSLDALYVTPSASAAASPDGGSFDWSRLFAEARLDMAGFAPAPADPALPMPGDRRVAWMRADGPAGGPLRVDASELAGRPVAFRVRSARTSVDFVQSRFALPGERSTGANVAIVITLTFLVLAYAGAAYFMRRNLILGRGDRRGAGRLARVIGGLVFVSAVLNSSAPFDARLFGSLHGAAAVALFAGALCWVFYVAIEPFVRRQWPRMLIGWSRLMAGEWRDPQVGREVFLGSLLAVATTAVLALVNSYVFRSGGEPQAAEAFYFRALGSATELTAGVLQVVPWSVIVSLLWTMILLLVRRLVRSDWASIIVLSVFSLGLAPPNQWLFTIALLVTNVLTLILTLRIGFLLLVASIAVGTVLLALPIFPAMGGFVAELSWISMAAVAVPSLLGLYYALAGRSIFGDDDAVAPPVK